MTTPGGRDDTLRNVVIALANLVDATGHLRRVMIAMTITQGAVLLFMLAIAIRMWWS